MSFKKIIVIIILLVSFIPNLTYSQNISTSLTACYALNGNASEPINNLNGVLSLITPTVDRFNNSNSAMAFNGTGASFISLPNNTLLKPTNAVSFSGWVNFNNIIQNQYIVFAHNTCINYQEGYSLVGQNIGTGFKLHAIKSGGACSPATKQVLSSSSTMSANTWYHIGGYIGNDSLKIYINGVLEGSAPTTIAFNYSPTDNVYLGGANLPVNYPFNGSMDNVRFYNRKLSNSEFNQLYITDPICAILQSPSCNTKFYCLGGSIAGYTVSASIPTIPNTSTVIPVLSPPFSGGCFAIGPSFGFNSPNPTFWTVTGNGGNYYYFDETAYVNTNHLDLAGSGWQKNYGGSKNLIYSIDQLGQVFAYNGTGTASLITTVPTASNGIITTDIVGDDFDNFYVLKMTNPQALLVYNPSGVEICSYSITGAPTTTFASGGPMAIVGNTVTTYNNGQFYIGKISGSVVNFTPTAQSF